MQFLLGERFALCAYLGRPLRKAWPNAGYQHGRLGDLEMTIAYLSSWEVMGVSDGGRVFVQSQIPIGILCTIW
jgi:hypothetical protein